MKRTFVKSKIHRATVTDASLNYVGSISICPKLLAEADIQPYELVHINNLSNAAHWETYAIPGNTGDIVLNGPPSRLFQKGDLVVIFNTVQLDADESIVHKTIFVDEKNNSTGVKEDVIGK